MKKHHLPLLRRIEVAATDEIFHEFRQRFGEEEFGLGDDRLKVALLEIQGSLYY